LALVIGVAACGEAPADATDILSTACAEARDVFAAAPAPADADSEAAFLEASDQAVGVVQDAIGELSGGADASIADLSWQLDDFPTSSDSAAPLVRAQRASAAIVRIDRFAEALSMPGCGAATWRPADWRTLAGRHKEDRTEAEYQESLNLLCSDTFPNPSLLRNGRPLLEALAATGESGGGAAPDDLQARVLARLNSTSDRGSRAGRFLRDFSRQLPELSPPDTLERQHISLIAAFMHIDSVLPNVIPDDPPTELRSRTDPAFDELEEAWGALEITC
jgi:hypothetical protein